MDDVVALVTDLFFQSRIGAVARHTHRTVRFVTSDFVPRGHVLALVDLDADGDVLGAIRRFKAESRSPVVAFGPHVDTAGRRAARAAGADRVLAKSRFVSELPDLFRSGSTT